MSKQTALQWFIEQLEIKGDMRETQAIRIIQINIDTSEYLEIKKQALQMEREQIVNAVDGFPLYTRDLLGNDYYNELYGGQDE
jgi:hypothetical protein